MSAIGLSSQAKNMQNTNTAEQKFIIELQTRLFYQKLHNIHKFIYDIIGMILKKDSILQNTSCVITSTICINIYIH